MAQPTLPDADPLTGDERLVLRQGGRSRGLLFSAFRDWLMGPVQTALSTALAPILARVSALETAGTAQAARDAAQDAALSQEATARQAADAAEVLARQAVSTALASETGARTAADSSEATARASADTAQAARLAALETRPEEAAHFTGSAKLPAITLTQPVTLTLTGLVPAVTGDRVRKGEAVVVQATAGLPTAVDIANAYAPADDTVAVQLTTGINLAAGTSPITWAITVLR